MSGDATRSAARRAADPSPRGGGEAAGGGAGPSAGGGAMRGAAGAGGRAAGGGAGPSAGGGAMRGAAGAGGRAAGGGAGPSAGRGAARGGGRVAAAAGPSALDRRGLLRAGAALIAAPAVLAACGTRTALHPNRTAYPIDASGTSPPAGDLARLLAERAEALGMAPRLTVTGSRQLPTLLAAQTRRGEYDPRTNRTPPVNGVVVVGVTDRAALAAAAATARRHGVRLVSYPVALPDRAAGVRFDLAGAAAALVAHVAREASERGLDRGAALVLLPAVAQVGVQPFAEDAVLLQRALASGLAAAAPQLSVLATSAFGPDAAAAAVRGARAARADLRVVLAWDDATALGAVRVLRGERACVGALGAPAASSRETLTELRRDDVLRVVLAAAPDELAAPLVALPRALLAGERPRDVTLPLHVLTPRAPGLAAYAAQYATTPVTTAYDDTPLTRPR